MKKIFAALVPYLPALPSPAQLVWFVVAIIAVTRFFFVTAHDFPLNDGGMFYAMVEDIERAHFKLPIFISYNQASIPFAYPPLGFYIAAAIHSYVHVSLIDIFRFLPFILSIVSLPLIYLLTKRLTHSASVALMSTLIYGLTPRSFEYMIMGGGVVRAWGLIFGLLTCISAYDLFQTHTRKQITITGTLFGLTALTHSDIAVFIFYSIVFIGLVLQTPRKNMYSLLFVFLIAGGISSLWWAPVLMRHGLSPFLSASHEEFFSRNAFQEFFFFRFSDDRILLPSISPLFGCLYCLFNKKKFLLIWFLLILLLSPRSYMTYITIPFAMMTGLFVRNVLLNPPFIRNSSKGYMYFQQVCILGIFTFYMLLSQLFLAHQSTGSFTAVLPEERHAMTWISSHTPADASFLILSGESWWTDKSAEWFPVLAKRKSVNTVQGTEWLANNRFKQARTFDFQIKQCVNQSVLCIEKVLIKYHINTSYIYLQNQNNYYETLYNSLSSSKKYEALYKKGFVSLWKKL